MRDQNPEGMRLTEADREAVWAAIYDRSGLSPSLASDEAHAWTVIERIIAGRVTTAKREVAAAIRADIKAEIEGEDVLAVRAGLDFAADIARVYQNRYTRDGEPS